MTAEAFARDAALPVLGLAVVLAFVRLVRGPSLADRVVAFDMLSAVGIGILAAYAVSTGRDVYIDLTVILALVSFLGTIAFAYYLRKKS
ncbi:MAG: cation:proton antiporter [Polyangiaceae bacterium]